MYFNAIAKVISDRTGRYSVDKTVFILYNAQRLKMGSRNAARFVC